MAIVTTREAGIYSNLAFVDVDYDSVTDVIQAVHIVNNLGRPVGVVIMDDQDRVLRTGSIPSPSDIVINIQANRRFSRTARWTLELKG